MLKIWGRRNSFNVQKVMWLVGELGLEHEHINADGSFGGLDAPSFLAMNPHGRVPVIADDDGTTVWESHTIIRYLAARYGLNTFCPADPAERSLADRWMDWALATLQPDFMDVFWGFYRPPPSPNGTGPKSGTPSRDARETIRCWIGIWSVKNISRATDSRSGTSRREPRSIVTFYSISNARDFRTSRHGTAAWASGRPIASMS